MKYTAEFIKDKIFTDNLWLFRAVLAIYKLQTQDEKRKGFTRHNNNVGFNGPDSVFLSSIAELITLNRSLSEKQIYVTKKKMIKYCGQLAKIANKEI